jgi:sulfite reductase (ferredoxin)
MSTDAPKLSPVEAIKEESRFLKGTIAEEIAGPIDHFNDDNLQLLKFHGTYQQDDRDIRSERNKAGLDKAYSMMVRLRIPGGRITSDQFLAMLDLCEEMGNATMKITTRQTIQLHGVVKDNLRPTIKRVNEIALSTLAACGDVNRNIMCCPAKRAGRVHAELERLTDELTEARSGLPIQNPARRHSWVAAKWSSPCMDRRTCRASSKWALPFPMTIASMCTRRTSACWPSFVTIKSSATMSWLAVEWEPHRPRK